MFQMLTIATVFVASSVAELIWYNLNEGGLYLILHGGGRYLRNTYVVFAALLNIPRQSRLLKVAY